MNRFPILALAAALLAGPAVAADAPAKVQAKAPAKAAPAGDSSLKTDQDKTLYVLGAVMGQKMTTFRLTEGELEIIRQGMSDSVLGRPLKADVATYGPKIDELAKTRAKAYAADEKKREQPYLDKAAAAKGAVKKPSGLIFTEVKAGSGAKPTATDKVKVHYTGTLSDGSIFDSSIQRKEPMTIALNQVLPCWTEGLQLMKVGGKAKIVCPSSIAYGDVGAPPKVKPGATLTFEVELLEITK
jgi:FKBP-type peptidyl-prolyl cis-trans isomerase FkpA/FKBP-type peptidyl-prolyl cis-trans isomerase FklB